MKNLQIVPFSYLPVSMLSAVKTKFYKHMVHSFNIMALESWISQYAFDQQVHLAFEFTRFICVPMYSLFTSKTESSSPDVVDDSTSRNHRPEFRKNWTQILNYYFMFISYLTVPTVVIILYSFNEEECTSSNSSFKY